MGIIRDSFVVLKTWAEAIEALPEEYQLETYKALTKYGLYGVIPQDLSPVVNAMLISFSKGMENNIARYNASVENGKKGGRPKKETQQNLEKPSKTQVNLEQPNHNLNVNVDVNDNVNENNLVDDDISSTNIPHTCACEKTTTSTTLQDLEELKSLCKGISIDCLVDGYQYNFSLLVQKVKESRYLKMFRSLSELLNKYDYIIADKYKDFNIATLINENSKEARKHEYTKEELDALLDDIYEVDI